jgi:hypothetical protein
MMPEQHFNLIHPTEPRALLVAANGAWALPSHEADEAPAIRQVMRERYGLDATLLGVVGGRYLDAEHDEESAVFALEVHATPGTLPAGARWVSQAELAGLMLAAPEQRPLIETRLREAEGSAEPPPGRVPWARPGWLATASAWIGEQLARLGYRDVGPVEQVRIRPWSAVLRAATSVGAVYFKAVATTYTHEVPLTAMLGDTLPQHTPRVLVVDAARGWMLLADAGTSLGPALRDGGDPASYAAALGAFARFQMATVPRVERLLALGCPDRRLERLPAQFARAVADRETLAVGRVGVLSEPDYARLQAMTPEVERLCAELASYRLPVATLHHDEITPGHVIPTGAGFIFFDWGDSAITHPLCSLMMPLRWTRLVLGYDADALAHLRDAYLALWTEYEPLGRLREAYSIAARLALLCRALTWYDFLPPLERGARWEFDDSAGYFLGLFLNGED